MSPTTGSTLARWRQRMLDLGLNPDIDGHDFLIIRHTDSLEEYKRWWAFPPRSDSKVNKVDPAKIAKIPDALVRRYVQDHITNARVFTNPKAIRALEKRVGRFFVHVRAAPNRVCTAKDPIIVNSGNEITNYNEITIKDGGYIEITTACKFEAQVITKIQGGAAGRKYDVYIVGKPGRDAKDGVNPPAAGQAIAGKDAKCDCCGGAPERKATDGAPGKPGTNGFDATHDATVGEEGPNVYFFIHESFNGSGGLTFLNQGGNGGNGGRGGNGAIGQQGGNGGNGIRCGGITATGGTGGTGGRGGGGGNGSNGKNGGNGGTLEVWVPDPVFSDIIVTNGRAPGGLAGAKGRYGIGGEGGKGGNYGGKHGERGLDGPSDGDPGRPGEPGEKGTSFVNGRMVS